MALVQIQSIKKPEFLYRINLSADEPEGIHFPHTHIAHMTKHSQTPKRLNGTIKVIKSAQSTRAWNCSSFQCYQSHTEFKSGRKQNKTWPLTGPCCSSSWHAKIYTYVPPETQKQNAHKQKRRTSFCFHKSGTSEGMLCRGASQTCLLNEYTVSCCWPESVQNRWVCV